MILASRNAETRNTEDFAALIDSWASCRNPPWVPTSSRRVLVTCITESTLAAARSCIRDSHAACSGVPWKRYLSLLSRVADQPGSDPQFQRASILVR
jgi:hypothetical protein